MVVMRLLELNILTNTLKPIWNGEWCRLKLTLEGKHKTQPTMLSEGLNTWSTCKDDCTYRCGGCEKYVVNVSWEIRILSFIGKLFNLLLSTSWLEKNSIWFQQFNILKFTMRSNVPYKVENSVGTICCLHVEYL